MTPNPVCVQHSSRHINGRRNRYTLIHWACYFSKYHSRISIEFRRTRKHSCRCPYSEEDPFYPNASEGYPSYSENTYCDNLYPDSRHVYEYYEANRNNQQIFTLQHHSESLYEKILTKKDKNFTNIKGTSNLNNPKDVVYDVIATTEVAKYRPPVVQNMSSLSTDDSVIK